MGKQRRKRVLLVASDNVLESLADHVRVDFLGGYGREMGRSHLERNGEKFVRLLAIALRVFFRRYDKVILPSLYLTYLAKFGRSPLKKLCASILLSGSNSKVAVKFGSLARLLVLGRDRVAFIDRIECVYLCRHLFQYFERPVVFKTNAHREYPKNERVKVVPVPFWINTAYYSRAEGKPFPGRDREVFFAGALCSNQRRLAPLIEEIALRQGVDFHWPRERLAFDQFLDCLGDSKIALSPEGSIWNCWRHYEALLLGAIPLINRPDPRIYHQLKEGESCFFYDSPEHAVEIMEAVLGGGLSLTMDQEERRQFVLERCSDHAAGRQIAGELGLLRMENLKPNSIPCVGG